MILETILKVILTLYLNWYTMSLSFRSEAGLTTGGSGTCLLILPPAPIIEERRIHSSAAIMEEDTLPAPLKTLASGVPHSSSKPGSSRSSPAASPATSPTKEKITDAAALVKQLATYKEELTSQKPEEESGAADSSNTLDINLTVDSLYDDSSSDTPRSRIDLEESLLLGPSQLGGNRDERSALRKCPCGLSDRTSSYITCANCEQDWHNKCCNLKGVTPASIKKLDEWECPRCYVCPLVDTNINVVDVSPDESGQGYLKSILEGISRLEASSKETKDSAHALHQLHSKLATTPSLEPQLVELKDLTRELVSNIPKNSEWQEEEKVIGHRIESLEMEIGKLAASIGKLDSHQSEQPQEKAGEERMDKLEQEMKKLTAGIEAFTSQQHAAHLPPAMMPGQKLPNTTTPVIKSSQPPCKAYKLYKESTVPQELKEELLSFLTSNKSDFAAANTEENSRKVLYFGKYKYKYKGADHEPKEMPDAVTKLLSLVQENLPEGCPKDLNSCLIHHYADGDSVIPLHRDDEPVIDPESPIITVSLGATRTLAFHSNGNVEKTDVQLEDRSILVCSRRSQDFWAHELLRDSDSKDERFSFTFRTIGPQFLNSTIILGDSNTRYVKFGSDFGTLGPNVPGKRVHVGHLEALPGAAEIGPYRNIIIHTGINSLSSKKYPRSNQFLARHLEAKCREYMAVYPKCKIHISMVLPTRLPMLNYRVREFNSFILDMTYGVRNLAVIDNSMFGDKLDDSHGRFDMEKKQPMRTDIVHLGKLGIRLLASGFKTAVRGKVGSSESQKRFKGGGGNYAVAASRASSQGDGYQGKA